MEIVNPGNEDYHMHSINYSDGLNTIDEIVKFAGEIGLKKIAITDHNQAYLDARTFPRKSYRGIIKRWQNVFNNVKVEFGVEADILNSKGDVCMDIQGEIPELIILSTHQSPPYQEDSKTITEGYLNAIERFHDKINFLGHPCSVYHGENVDIIAVTELCNKYEIPLEVNGANLATNRTNLNKLKQMLSIADQIYVNSDAHTLNELKTVRRKAFQYLRENGYIKGKYL
ncbi:MAG: PHP domain-containing protein [Ignavibacteriales bacterium]|nr:PHP domain-containing protein [Ignavibacteriales bacterium]MCB9208702.1 PHP domain-containing protein [Ignavibacteriales bacterium]MCB9218380.1 PHP domain-containing protein [Ignavibacteriales bacterium]MCB9260676.1 PHP domain-containing protein [Ignavibacteriales bacterium]